MIIYMVAFVIASLSAIAVEDLKLGYNSRASLTQSKLMKNKLSSKINKLVIRAQERQKESNRT